MVQKLIEKLANSKNEIKTLIKDIQPLIMSFIVNSNAYHIILKCFAVLDDQCVIPILSCLKKNVNIISIHKIGCCAIQKCVDYTSTNLKLQLMVNIAKCSNQLVFDSYGHYVVCHVIAQKNQKLNKMIIDGIIEGSLFESACNHKSASLAIEKLLEFSHSNSRNLIINELLKLLGELIKSTFGIKSKSTTS